jgi:hypothetical protein
MAGMAGQIFWPNIRLRFRDPTGYSRWATLQSDQLRAKHLAGDVDGASGEEIPAQARFPSLGRGLRMRLMGQGALNPPGLISSLGFPAVQGGGQRTARG